MSTNPIYLGVNIDHVATLRQARGTIYPEPIQAALLAEEAGADGITVHLREDCRHIQARDVELLAQVVQTRLNLEMALTEDMLDFACRIKPRYVCLVPERRQELTTEGGLEVAGQMSKVKQACQRLAAEGIEVSLFIDPDPQQITAAHECGAPVIEIHTGAYADSQQPAVMAQALSRIQQAAAQADQLGLQVNAGHGLHYHNVIEIAQIPSIIELNIGHAIVARALFSGFYQAVKDMKQLLLQARTSAVAAG